jgi:uncharacterized membrane protein
MPRFFDNLFEQITESNGQNAKGKGNCMGKRKDLVLCPVCKLKKESIELLHGSSIRPSLREFIQRSSPTWNEEESICVTCLNQARSSFVEQSLIAERGVLTDAEERVIDAIKSQELIAVDSAQLEEKRRRFKDIVADKMAEIGGSWTFIGSFVLFMAIWIYLNVSKIEEAPFDPYPFILLNLLLSCVAALQAPVIMMSQRRQDAKDRARSESDYATNLKAELEIRHLHIKLDQLMSHQWQRLIEIQQIQLDTLRDMKK